MASQRARSRNNVKAGALTLVCLILFVVWIVAVGDLLEIFQPKRRYVLEFPLAMGTQGLTVGSAVEVGGQPVGHVSRIEREPGDDKLGLVVVTVAIERGLNIYENAEVELRRPLLGAGAALNFSYLGDEALIDAPGHGNSLLEPDKGERLRGVLAPGFLTQLGFTREDIEATKAMLANLEEITERVAHIAAQLEGELPGRFHDLERMGQDLSSVIEEFRSRWPAWMERFDGVIARAEAVTATAERVSENVDAGVTQARELMGEVQGEWEAAAPKMQRILDNVEEGTAIAKTDLLTLIEEARAGMEGYASLGRQLSQFSAEQQPSLERTLANARLASEQLKLTAQEVRRAPWRLLYRPSERETKEELLYDAARSYAQAVNDLWAASEALREVETEGGAATRAAPERVEQLLDQMQRALDDYELVEQAFLEKLSGE